MRRGRRWEEEKDGGNGKGEGWDGRETSHKRETRAKPKISNWTRLNPASVLPHAATEMAPTQNFKVTTRIFGVPDFLLILA